MVLNSSTKTFKYFLLFLIILHIKNKSNNFQIKRNNAHVLNFLTLLSFYFNSSYISLLSFSSFSVMILSDSQERESYMFQDQRREKILQLLQENGSCRVHELKKLFNVSEPTIRSDLESLEKSGFITRQHGGAFLNTLTTAMPSLSLPKRGHEEEKARIGRRAAEFDNNGDSIILDSGTTVSEMIRHLKDRSSLNIVTNALNIALHLGMEPTNHVLVVGGEFKPPTFSLTGEKGLSIFENLYVEKLFLATGGFSLEAGLTYPSLPICPSRKR